ncbi:MAG: hypothetical protein K1X67_14760 [Fimbriimonadaceae bacterium]|nr:hypothetical protein [Fimbriimonadaceae bacterium]
MGSTGIAAAFAHYGAVLRNVQWSVSAWTPAGELVVSLWDHHYRKGASGTMEFADSFDRWSGAGNNEFRANVSRALAEGSRVRLVLVKTRHISHVERGEDASKIDKDFFVRDDLIGEVAEIAGSDYVFRFRKA